MADAVSELLGSIGGCLAEVLTAEAELCELAALVADPGALAQMLHPDTRIVPGFDHAGLVTAFLTLQDITGDMGPTEVAPGTHVARAHEALKNDVGLAWDFGRGANTSTSDLSSCVSQHPFNGGEGEGDACGIVTAGRGQDLAQQGPEPKEGGRLRSWGFVQPVPLHTGDALLVDSRTWHRGSSNVSSLRRSLLYVSFQVPANAPPGSTYSLLDEYRGRFRLSNLHRWRDPFAREEETHGSMQGVQGA